VRFSKKLEATERLPVHVVGAFCFGGPVPVMGLLNFPDLRKDSNLSVTTLEKILDTQWEALEKKMAGDSVTADCAAAAKPTGAAAADSAAGAAPSPGAPEARGFIPWPHRLHVTFDNAQSECKNQWMFRFLGALVLHNVFRLITVGTLLVGHTHDIVDQMFSVWAKILRINDANTYEQMRKLFREKYHSKIHALLEIMKGAGKSAAAAAAFKGAAHAEAATEAAKEAIHEEPQLWDAAAAKKLEEFSKEVFADTSIQPEIVQQIFSVNVAAWMDSNVSLKELNTKDRELQGLAGGHNFQISKDKATGDVYLYSKYLVDSETRSTRGEVHRHLNLETGGYTSSAVLWRADELFLHDPIRMPPLRVATEKYRDTARTFLQEHAMSPTEHDEFNAHLKQFDAAQDRMANECSTCAQYTKAFAAIGVISRKKNATKEQLDAARDKETERRKLHTAMTAHTLDAAFAAQHEMHILHNWWRKWVHRVKESILPSWIERGIVPDPANVGLAYHTHPRVLPVYAGEAPAIDEISRVDVSWLRDHGLPEVGHLVITRTTNPREPFWIGRIVREVGKSTDDAAAARVAEAGAAQSAAELAPEGAAGDSAAGSATHSAALEFGVMPRRERTAAKKASAVPGLEELPNYAVQWLEVDPATYKALHLSDQPEDVKVWATHFATHGTTKEDACAASAAGTAPPALPWVFDMWMNRAPPPKFNVAYHAAKEDRKKEVEIEPVTMIVWGPPKKILTNDDTLTQLIRTRLREDLTEEKKAAAKSSKTRARPAASSARPSRGGAAAAKPRPVKRARKAVSSDDDDDSDASYSSQCEWEVSAAPAPARHSSRSTHARNVTFAEAPTDEESEEEKACDPQPAQRTKPSNGGAAKAAVTSRRSRGGGKSRASARAAPQPPPRVADSAEAALVSLLHGSRGGKSAPRRTAAAPSQPSPTAMDIDDDAPLSSLCAQKP
jgi:hypothetical protein